MEIKGKTLTLSDKFPIRAVEKGHIISKEGDITIAFEVTMPELFTVTSGEYEAIHSTLYKAIMVLPPQTIVHKQDWYTVDSYAPKWTGEETFLGRSYQMHFNERPFLNHRCYLYLTKTTKQRMAQESTYTILTRSRLVSREITEDVSSFLEAVDQFERVINDSETFSLRRMSTDDLVATASEGGLLENYFNLFSEDTHPTQDIVLGDEVKIGDQILCLHTLSNTEDLPTHVSTERRYERLSTDRSDCLLCFSAPVGLMLSCNHMYNQYIFIDESVENLKRFEGLQRNMHSLANYSRENAINAQWIGEYLDTAHSLGVSSVRAHFNIIAWSDDRNKLRQIKNDVGSALAQMECRPRHNIIDTATLFWAAIPGNAGDFPKEESYYTFINPALCFFAMETNYRSSLSPFGIKVSDRLTGKPLHLDISDEPMKKGYTTNRNKFILGPSGSGKSFFTNHMVHQYYEQGTHVVLVDTGNSYLGLCELIRNKTKGEDGVYFTYSDKSPISFNPFYTDDLEFDVEKRESILTLILTLWKSDSEPARKTETALLGEALNGYIACIQSREETNPCFNGFYDYLNKTFRQHLEQRDIKVEKEEFNLNNLLTTLSPYYRGGRYDFLLNSDKNLDLLSKRFIVFEIDAIKDNKDLFPVVTIIIMEAFINKMRRLKGIRKMILIEEAWKAIASANMADYIKYLYKTVRKFFGEAIVVTQEVEDIIQSPIVKESIINNSDCKILLDQSKFANKFDSIQNLLGLTDKEVSQIHSINKANDPKRLYKEVFISLGGQHSAVYAVEVSTEEYLTYTTEEREKLEVLRLAEELDGNMELAIRRIAQEKRDAKERK